MAENADPVNYAQAFADLNIYYKKCQLEVVDLIDTYKRLIEECTQTIQSIETDRQAFLAEEEGKKTDYLETTKGILKSIEHIERGMLKGSMTATSSLQVKLVGRKAELAAVNSLPEYVKAMNNIKKRRAELDERSEITERAKEKLEKLKKYLLKGTDGSTGVAAMTTRRTKAGSKTKTKTKKGTMKTSSTKTSSTKTKSTYRSESDEEEEDEEDDDDEDMFTDRDSNSDSEKARSSDMSESD